MNVENKAITKRNYSINVQNKSSKLHHNWKKLMTIGKAKECLYEDVQKQLKRVKEATNFQYLRFHGIFDDEMMLYGENESGEPECNFLYTDKLFDFLKRMDVKPFVELGFMPEELAESPNETVFYKKSIVSKPKDIEKWSLLIRNFIVHYENKYGVEEVLSWYFEVWNEPDFHVFWRGTFEDYCQLYKTTYETIKQLNPNYKVGGPSIVTIKNSDSLKQFLDFCIRENCVPDFISFHSYSHEEMEVNKKKKLLDESSFEFGYISRNEDFLKDKIDTLKHILAGKSLGDIDVHLTEWNSTAFHRDLTNDTSFKAAYIVKNILENMDSIGSFGYWTASDLIEEQRASSQTFHGGLGLITNNNIPKPAFYAYELLGKLGDQFVDAGEGYFVTKNSRGYQIILYHYCHYDRLYCINQHANIDRDNRYDVFLERGDLRVKLTLTGLANGIFLIKQHQLNREHGSAFDKWVELGAPEYLSDDEIDYLRYSSIPKKHISEVKSEGELILSATLQPHEVQLIEIIPKRTI